MCDEYNGWSNRETWAMALHLSNDEGLWRHFRGKPAWEIQAEVGAAAEAVFFPEFPGEGEMWARLLLSDVGSLWRVDWCAVAASLSDA